MEKERVVNIILIGFGIFLSLSITSLLLHLYFILDGYKIGFPLEFYYKFHARGNNFNNYGFNKFNLLCDLIIAVLLSNVITTIYRNRGVRNR
jgi:hypothetical protein